MNLDSEGNLALYLIGIDGDEGTVYQLENGVTVNTDDYDHVYLMVFNTDYDDDILECESVEYEISVNEGGDNLAEVFIEVDASNFRELEN